MGKLSCVTWISLLAALACTVTCHNAAGESPSAKYKRDPYSVLARFAADELSVHSRRRRDTLVTLLELTYQIEDVSKELLYTDIDGLDIVEIENLESSYGLLITEYCFYSRNYDSIDFIIDQTGCAITKYRKYNGECNNIGHPRWGSADYPTRRLLEAIYSDDSYTPAPMTVSARNVSLEFVGHDHIYDEYFASELVMHIGQFIDHDLALTPHLGATCGCEETRECLPIECDPESDPLCSEKGCMKFARSRPVIEAQYACDVTSLKPHCRTHPNLITSFLDASNVYGSYEYTAFALREHEGGLLTMKEGADPNSEEHIHLLPGDEENNDCEVGAKEELCGKSGDIRAAEQPVLTSLHTLFANEHNRIARELQKQHSCWDDETLFQEARRILIATMQKIVYGEWLPLVIGAKTMEKYELGLWRNYIGYNDSVDPTIYNDFASAFFRFGHSMAPESLKRVKPDWEDTHDDIDLKETFFNASIVHDLGNGGINSLILGTLEKQLLAIDRHHSKSIHEHLFANINEGLDLVALNIQRGRDHGLPGYIKYREECGYEPVTSFTDLEKVMDKDALKALEKIYDYVEEVEPFVGMLAERHMSGALVGETLGCVLGKQFQNLKYGDRYWFENDLSEKQLEAINKVTMARVICDNVSVKSIQPAVFKMNSKEEVKNDVYFYDMINKEPYPDSEGRLNSFVNNRVSCDDHDAIPILDLSAWEDEISNTFDGFYYFKK